MAKSRNKGINNPFFGKTHSSEDLEQMRLSHTGKKRPPFSDKWKARISASRKGKFKGKDNPFFGKHHSEQTKNKLRNDPRCSFSGTLSPSWKGGRTKSQGYWQIKSPGHPRANQNNYVYEHLLIWEKANGVPLPKGHVVHHINGIKHDNRPVNLKAMPKPNHHPWLVLQLLQERLRDVEAELLQLKKGA